MRLQRYLKVGVLKWVSFLIFNSTSAQTEIEYLRDSVLKSIDNGMIATIRYRPKDSAGAIGLPNKYSSPSPMGSDMFSELYYWDAFFSNRYYWLPKAKLGNIEAFEIARGNVNNLIYLVNKYGFVPNANRFSMLNRSQLPLLSEMVKDIFEISGDVNWLQTAVEALEREHQFWMQNRAVQVKVKGDFVSLNRFGNQANREQLIGFYKFLKQRLQPNSGYLLNGAVSVPSTLFDAHTILASDERELDSQLYFASHLLAEAESGWDFTPRFQGHCMDFIPVDLNAVLGSMEQNMVDFYRALQAFESDPYKIDIQNFRLVYYQKAVVTRKLAMDKYLWNKNYGCYLDYNWRKFDVGQPVRKQSLLTAASFWPIYLNWGKESNARSVHRMLNALMFHDVVMPIAKYEAHAQEMPYVCQWHAPNVWAPLQILAWASIQSKPLGQDFWMISAIKNSWLHLVTKQWETDGKFKEKYSAITNESDVQLFNNWQSIGTMKKEVNENFTVEEGYGTPTMMGWTAAVTYFFLLLP